MEHSACSDDLLWSATCVVIEDAGDAFGVECTDDNAIATKFEASGRMIQQQKWTPNKRRIGARRLFEQKQFWRRSKLLTPVVGSGKRGAPPAKKAGGPFQAQREGNKKTQHTRLGVFSNATSLQELFLMSLFVPSSLNSGESSYGCLSVTSVAVHSTLHDRRRCEGARGACELSRAFSTPTMTWTELIDGLARRARRINVYFRLL